MLRFVLAGAAPLLYGCGAQVYACGDASECPGGTCEASGYCSFPDDACPSGQRYGGYAPASLANACVELPGTSSSDGGDTTTTSPSSATIATLESSAGEVTSSSAGESTGAPITTAPSDESSTAPGSSDGAPSPDLPQEPAPCIVEDFDDGSIDGFTSWTDAPELVFSNGTLTLQLTLASSYAGIDSPTMGFVERDIQVTIVGLPNQAEDTQVALAVGTGTEAMLLLHEYDSLAVRYDDGVMLDNRIVVAPIEQSTWRIRSHAGELVFERQPPGGEWETLWTEAPPFDLAQSSASIFVGTWQDTLMPGAVVLDDLSDCPYQ